jgi:hypothetical protein
MSTLKLTHRQWHHVLNELHQEHPKSVFLLRDRMKKVLGFTKREHKGYRGKTVKEMQEHHVSGLITSNMYEDEKSAKFHDTHVYESLICLDFYSERKYTMFLLKFSEIINNKKEINWI